MNSRVRHLIAAVVVLAVLALAPAAVASPGAVLADCGQDGSLDGSYSDADKRAALEQMPADLAEYSDCRSEIAAGIGGVGPKAVASVNTGGPSAGTSEKTAAERPQPSKTAVPKTRRAQRARAARRLKQARQKREAELGARAVDPRNAGVLKAAKTANGVPLPVGLALGALGLLVLAGGLLAVWRRDSAFAGVLRRVNLPRFRR